jgi:subtilisin family serine protease
MEGSKYSKGDKIVRVAILDTGIDLAHADFQRPRAISFKEGQPVSATGEAPQWDRIKGTVNYCWVDGTVDDRNIQDLSGHGTQVAGIILRLAPKAKLYIARICEGDTNSGVAEEDKQVVDKKNRLINPKPEIVAKVKLGFHHRKDFIADHLSP